MTITEFWDKYKQGQQKGVSVTDFWSKYKAQQAAEAQRRAAQQAAEAQRRAELAQQAEAQISNVSPEMLQNMFGSYTSKVDPRQYGGYTPEYWQAAMSERIVAANPELAGKQFVVDFGGQGTQYKAPESYVQGGGGQYLGGGGIPYLNEPYSEEKLGFDAPLGAWVWGKEGEPVKVEGRWNRSSDQDPASYGWQWVSAYDPDTMNVAAVDKAYRSYVNLGHSYQGESDSTGSYSILGMPSHSFLDPAKEYTFNDITYTPATRTYWDESGPSEVQGYEYTGIDPDTGNPQQIFVRPEYVGQKYTESLPKEGGYGTPIYYLDPTKSTWGTYQDPAGRESTQMLSAMGYLPDKGDFDYGHTWFEEFMQRNGQHIAMAIFTVATAGAGAAMGAAGTTAMSVAGTNTAAGALSAGATSAIAGGIAGAATGAASTGQRTNNPWQIVAGGAAGALGGAAPGINAAAGLGAGSLGSVALNSGIGSGAGFTGTYAATGDLNKSLRGGLIGGVSGGLAAAAAPAASTLSKDLISRGVNPTIANAASSGLVRGATSATVAGVQGQDVGQAGLGGLATGSIGSLSNRYLGSNWAPVTNTATRIGLSALRR